MKKTEAFSTWDEVPVVINVPYVAMILKTSQDVVRKHLAAGELRGFKVGREWRINKEELQRFTGYEEGKV